MVIYLFVNQYIKIYDILYFYKFGVSLKSKIYQKYPNLAYLGSQRYANNIQIWRIFDVLKLKELQLIEAFQHQDAVSVRDLYDYWVLTDGLSNRGTVDWRIHDLKQKKVLQEIKNGWYTLSVKSIYEPAPDKMHVKLDNIIRENYRNVRYSIWNMNWLNEFSVHQFNRDNLIIEIEKDLQDSLRNLLERQGFIDLAWMIGRQHMQLSGIKNPIYILPLLSRAPLREIKIDKKIYPVPSLEKILVDVYENDALFYYLQGAELLRIFEYVLSKYAVNFTTLFGYAKRRNKEKPLKTFIENNFPFLPKIITK